MAGKFGEIYLEKRIMKITDLPLAGLKLIELNIFRDERGYFTERFRKDKFEEAGLPVDFIQDNHSRSLPGVLRGLHYHIDSTQGKLVGVTSGKVWDVTVDLRTHSPTFGQSLAVELSDANGKMLWVPAGFAHGFCVTGEMPADLFYKVRSFYSPTSEKGIAWNDAELKIKWPIETPILSDRDRSLPSFADYRKKPDFSQ